MAAIPVEAAPIDATPAFTTRIDVANEADPTAAEVLRKSPGTAVRSLGGRGDFSTLSIRGSSSSQVALYIDGAPVSPTSVGTVDLSTLWLFDLQSIDVHRGFTPATLGPDGFLGAVVLRTPDKLQPGGVATVGAGSFWSRQAALQYAGAAGAWSLAGSLAYFGKQGDFPYTDDRGTPLVASDDVVTGRKNNDQNAGSFHFDARRGGIKLLGGARFRVATDFFTKEQGSPAPSSQLQQHARYAQWRPMLRLALDDWFVHPRVRVDEQLSVLGNVARFSDLAPSIYTGATEQTTRELEIRSNTVATWLTTEWLTLTTSFNVGGTMFDARAPSVQTQDRRRLLIGGAVTARGAWLADRLEVDAACRLDGLVDDGRSARGIFDRDSLDVVHTRRVWAQPTLGLRGVPVTGLAFAAHVGRRERMPTFYELFGSDGQIRGNPGLQPEAQWSWDLGAHYESKWIAADAIYAEARLEQLIALVYAGVELPRSENIGRALTRSVELSARSQPASFLVLAASYTFLLSENLSDGYVRGAPLPGRPPHQARGEVTFLIPRPVSARLMCEFQYIARTAIDTAGARLAPDRYLLNAALEWRVLDGPVRVGVELKNLLDQRTATVVAGAAGDRISVPVIDFLGFPLPGRSVFFTVSYAFKETAS